MNYSLLVLLVFMYFYNALQNNTQFNKGFCSIEVVEVFNKTMFYYDASYAIVYILF